LVSGRTLPSSRCSSRSMRWSVGCSARNAPFCRCSPDPSRAAGLHGGASGLRPAPFLPGVAFAALGLGLSTLAVHETREHARVEAATHVARAVGRHDKLPGELSDWQVFTQTSFREPALSSASQAGLVNNLNDGLAWGLFPVLFASAGLSVTRIGVLAALYPAVWGLGQLVAGTLSDRWGRKWLITTGMWIQAVGLAMVAMTDAFAPWAVAAVLLGAGTAMVYPTLLASVGDVAHPAWRARSVGVHRFWRDGGFAVGAFLAGVVADALGVRAAVWTVAALTAVSEFVAAIRMYEIHPRLHVTAAREEDSHG
jgi:Major Facilitator Superfamily